MSVFRKKDKEGNEVGEYYIDYYVNGRRRREKISTSKKLAEQVLAKRKIQIAENRFLNVRKQSNITFDKFAQLYLDLHSKPNKKSWKSSDVNSINRLKEVFGGRKLSGINQQEIERYKAHRATQVSKTSVNREIGCLKHMYRKAIEWGKVETSPVVNIKLYRQKNSRLRYLEKDEIKRLLDNCNDTIRPVVIVAVYTGMRRGEIYNLTWDDIDLQRGIIYVLDTKNSESREVPMSNVVRRTLVSLKHHPDSSYVFCKKDGTKYGSLKKSFLKALEKSGIMNFRFHDLRHTFASHLVMNNVDLNTVRELLGHKSLKMTLRYAHLSRDHKRVAIEHFDTVMDTIWTPSPEEREIDKKVFSHNVV